MDTSQLLDLFEYTPPDAKSSLGVDELGNIEVPTKKKLKPKKGIKSVLESLETLWGIKT